jgi:hypothetical protein
MVIRSDAEPAEAPSEQRPPPTPELDCADECVFHLYLFPEKSFHQFSNFYPPAAFVSRIFVPPPLMSTTESDPPQQQRIGETPAPAYPLNPP